jgi:acetoin utilization deacetylase AcuC-like enzyme
MDDLAFYYPQGHQGHQSPGHPERPQRVEVIRDALREVGWWEKYPHCEPVDIPQQVLYSVHRPDYLKILHQVCLRGEYYDADTYTTPASWAIAFQTAGGVTAVAEAVWRGRSRRGFALARPPGHHAKRSAAMGFCLINNIAIASEYLIQQADCNRLAIVDLDLHHGNGTEEIFYKRDDIFYLSTHQSPYYPGTGGVLDIGEGDGEGYNCNLPLPAFSGDRAFRTAMDSLIIPLLVRYKPEMILVSYGFDTHWRDPLGYLQLSAGMYGDLISSLVLLADQYCNGRIMLCLEGGYDLEAAKICSLEVTAALNGSDRHDILGQSPIPERDDWQTVVAQARAIWQV